MIPFPDTVQFQIMDTQRLVLFAIFSFSLLLLWESWQNKDQVPPAVQAQRQAATTAQSGAVPTPTSSPASGGQSAAPVSAVQATGLSRGSRAIVKTDLFSAQIDANGGDLRSLT